MMCRVKSKTVLILMSFLCVIAGIIAFELMLEGDAFADIDPSNHSFALDPKLETYPIHTWDISADFPETSPDSYEYKAGTLRQPNRDEPSPGEVFVGRQVEHLTYWSEGTSETAEASATPPGWAYNGLVRITLDVWGADFFNEKSGAYENPLWNLQDREGEKPTFVEVVDNFGEFILKQDPEGGTGENGNIAYEGSNAVFSWRIEPRTRQDASDNEVTEMVLVWDVHDPTAFIGQKLQISYVLELDTSKAPDDPENPESGDVLMRTDGHWYQTGTATARFRPNGDNTMYWERRESQVQVDGIIARVKGNGDIGIQDTTQINDSGEGDDFLQVEYGGKDGFTFDFLAANTDGYTFTAAERAATPGLQNATKFPPNMMKDGFDIYQTPYVGGAGSAYNEQAFWNGGLYRGAGIRYGTPVRMTIPQGFDDQNRPIPPVVKYLEWNCYRVPGTYEIIITIKGAIEFKDKPGVKQDLQYSFTFNGPGFNSIIAQSRIIPNVDYIPIVGRGDDEYNWVGDVLISQLGQLGQIQLEGKPPQHFVNITVAKSFGVDPLDFHKRWGVHDNTIHELSIHIEDSDPSSWLAFRFVEETEDNFIYECVGSASSPSLIKFSVNKPSLLLNVPAMDAEGVELVYHAYEKDPWAGNPRGPNVVPSFHYNEHEITSDDQRGVFTAGYWDGEQYLYDPPYDETTLTVTNQFDLPAYGELLVRKFIDQHAVDSGVSPATLFKAKIYDVDGYNGPDAPGGNYLLFRPEPCTPNDTRYWDEVNGITPEYPYGYELGTLYCTGNTGALGGILEEYLDIYEEFVLEFLTQNSTATRDDALKYFMSSEPYDNLEGRAGWNYAGDNLDPWFWSDKVWQREVLLGNETALTYLTISQDSNAMPPRVSNLWPGEYRIHEYKNDNITKVPVTHSPPEATAGIDDIWTHYVEYSSGGTSRGMVEAHDLLQASVRNTYLPDHDSLSLTKRFIGPNEAWGISAETTFTVRLVDEAKERVLLFAPHEDVNNPHERIWEYVGTASIHDSDLESPLIRDSWDGKGDPVRESKITSKIYIYGSPTLTTLKDLFKNYEGEGPILIDEIDLEGLWSIRMLIDGVDYDPNDPDAPRRTIKVADGEHNPIEVYNAYLSAQYRRGGLIKSLSGDYADFGISDETTFQAGGYNIATGRRLLFQRFPSVDFEYKSIIDDELHVLEGSHWHHVAEIDQREFLPNGSENPDFGKVFRVPHPIAAGKDWQSTEIVYDSLQALYDDTTFIQTLFVGNDPYGHPHHLEEGVDELNFVEWIDFSVMCPAQICRLLPVDLQIIERQKDDPNTLIDESNNPFLTPRIVGVSYLEDIPATSTETTVAMSTTAVYINNHYHGALSHLDAFSLSMRKELAGAYEDWDVDAYSTFYTRVYNTESRNRVASIETGYSIAGPVYTYLGEYVPGSSPREFVTPDGKSIDIEDALAALNAWLGTSYGEGDIVTRYPISANPLGHAQITRMPAGNYRVVEQPADPAESYASSYFSKSHADAEGITLGEPSQGLTPYGFVKVVNTFAGPGEIIINKDLAGTPGDWGVNADTVFKARIYDDEGNILLFSKNAAGDDSLEASRTYVGYTKDGLDTFVGGFTGARGVDYAETINFSVNNPILLAKLPAHPRDTYTIEELLSDDVYGVSIYEGTAETGAKLSDNEVASFELIHDEVGDSGRIFTIANDYLNKERAAVTVYKSLAGDWASYEGVSVDTTFSAYMSSPTNDTGRTLLFEPRGERDFARGGADPDIRDVYRFIGELDEDGETIHRLVWLSDTARGESHDAAWTWDDSEKLTDQGYTTLLVVSETKPANVYGLPPGEYEVCEDTTGLASYISVSYASSVGSVRRSDATVELADRNSGSVVISNAYDDRTATLDISKETTGIAGDWDVDDSTVFAARLIDADNNALWAVFELGSSGEYTYAGIYDSRSGGSYELLAGFVEGSVTYDIEFSAENAAKLKGIPVAPGKKYQIEELNPGNAYDVDVMLDGDDIRRAGVLAAFSDEFALSDTEHTEITFVNKYYGKEKISIDIEKYLDGDYERFGIKASDNFKAELSLTEGSYQGLKLYFKLDADANYQLVGALNGITILELVWDGKAEKSEGSGLASWSLEEYTGELPEGWTTEIEFSRNKPAKLVGMVFGYYELEELYLTDFSYVVDYDGYGLPGDSFDPDGGGAELYENGLATRFTVINTWESRPVFLGNGILNITKTLAGNPGSWGVNNNTNFEARLQRAGTSRAIALVQDTTSLIPNSWIYVGEVVSAGNYADSTGTAIVIQDALAALSTELGVTLTTADIKTSFSISRAQGATIRGLEAVSYRVIETNNTALGTYTISYNPSGGTVTMADNSLSVGVTNTFSTKPGPPTPPPAPKPPTPPPPAPKPVPKPPLPKKEVKVPVVKRSTAKPTPKPPVQESRRMPRTGDFVNMGLWILLIGAAGTAGAVALKKKSKKEVDETDLGSQDE